MNRVKGVRGENRYFYFITNTLNTLFKGEN